MGMKFWVNRRTRWRKSSQSWATLHCPPILWYVISIVYWYLFVVVVFQGGLSGEVSSPGVWAPLRGGCWRRSLNVDPPWQRRLPLQPCWAPPLTPPRHLSPSLRLGCLVSHFYNAHSNVQDSIGTQNLWIAAPSDGRYLSWLQSIVAIIVVNVLFQIHIITTCWGSTKFPHPSNKRLCSYFSKQMQVIYYVSLI